MTRATFFKQILFFRFDHLYIVYKEEAMYCSYAILKCADNNSEIKTLLNVSSKITMQYIVHLVK